MGVHIGATWQIRWIDLCAGGGDAACRYHCCDSITKTAENEWNRKEVIASVQVQHLYQGGPHGSGAEGRYSFGVYSSVPSEGLSERASAYDECRVLSYCVAHFPALLLLLLLLCSRWLPHPYHRIALHRRAGTTDIQPHGDLSSNSTWKLLSQFREEIDV